MAKDIALFDLDGTLADFEGALRKDLELLRSPHEPEIGNLWEEESIPYIKARMRLIKRQPGWWKNLGKFQLGWDVFYEALALEFEVHVLSKGPSKNDTAWGEKRAWCDIYLDDYGVKVHLTEDKSVQYGKVLVDDFQDYIESWLEFRERGLVIMPANDGNKNFKHPNVIRYDGSNLNEVRQALSAAKLRTPKQHWKDLIPA